MKKLLSVFLIVAFSGILLLNFSCVDSQSTTTTTIESGHFVYCGGTNNYKDGYWKNGVWNAVDGLRTDSLVASGNDIYVCREFSNSPGYWKNWEWNQLKCMETDITNVYKMAISGSDIYAYVGNIFSSTAAGGTKVTTFILKNGEYHKSIVNSNISINIINMFVNNENVYLIGSLFNTASSYSGFNDGWNIGYWKNLEWNSLPFSISFIYKSAFLTSGIILENDIYFAGTFVNEANISNACYWKNGEFNSLGIGTYISSINIINNEICLWGYKNNSLNISIAGYWENGVWKNLEPEDSNYDSMVTSVFLFENDVYAGGFRYENGKNTAGYWKNGVWNQISIENLDSKINSIAVVKK